MPATAPSGVRTRRCIGPACYVCVATCVALTTHVTLIVCVSQRASFIAVDYQPDCQIQIQQFNHTVHYLSSPPQHHCHGSLSQFITTISLPQLTLPVFTCHSSLPQLDASFYYQFAVMVGYHSSVPNRYHSSLPHFVATFHYHLYIITVHCHGGCLCVAHCVCVADDVSLDISVQASQCTCL